MKTTRLLSCGLALLTAFSLLAATPREEFTAIQKELQDKQTKFSADFRAAKTDAEREKLQKEMPDSAGYIQRVWALLEKNQEDPAAKEMAIWICNNGYSTKEAGQALAFIGKKFATSPEATALVPMAPYITASGKEFLLAIVANSPDQGTKAMATQSLYTHALMADPSQAEKYLSELETKYSEVKNPRGGTMADFVKKEKESNEVFGIGKVAPDIEGEDIDGKRFKLSDYRGKVVVIDFWGDW